MYFLDTLKLGPGDVERYKAILEESYILSGKCWIWMGEINGEGYGSFKGIPVHRLSYALFNADFRTNDFICHHCDEASCYNPSHLYAGCPKTNGADAARRKRIRSRSLYR